MNLTVLFLAVVLGGFIAYIADRVGRNLGKKRLSLFGLRPRTTAEILTTVAGGLIPFITILIILAVSKDARLYILHYNETIKQRDQLNSEVQEKNLTLKNEQGQLDGTKKSLVLERANLKVVTDENNQRSEELRKSTAELRKAQNRYAQAQAKYLLVEQRYTATQQRYTSLQARYASVEKASAAMEKKLGASEQKYSVLNAEYQRVSTSKKFVESELAKDKQEVLDDQKAVMDLTSRMADLNTTLRSTQDELNERRRDLNQAQDALKNAVATLSVDVPQANQFLLEPVIFNVGEEIARISVPSGLKPTDAGTYVDQLINKASEIALMHGGARSDLAQGHAAGFVPIPTQDAAGSQDSTLTPQAQYDEVVSELVDSKNSSVLIAKALYNRVKGNFVPLYMERKDNPLVFKQGQSIADTVIKGENSPGEIFDQVENFLRGKVAQKAKASKMVPIEGSDEGLGLVTSGDMLDLVEKIHQWGRNAKLTAFAKDNTYAGDRLALGFHLDQ